MSLQGSIHTWSDGIGYGAFIPTDRAYFNATTGRSLPSTEKLRDYRRSNVTAGIDTHRSDLSFGRTTESVRCGLAGDSRAREATKSLTSGEVGDFHWPQERARDGDVETILATASATASSASVGDLHPTSISGRGTSQNAPPMVVSARRMKQHEHAAETTVVSARNQPHQQQRDEPSGTARREVSARLRSPLSARDGSGGCTRRSDSTCAPSSSSGGSPTNSSRMLSSRSSASSLRDEQRPNNGRHTRPPLFHDKPHQAGVIGGRENRLRPRALLDRGRSSLVPAPKSARLRVLDPVFHRHRKYDLIAEERAAEGSQVTGRFGPVHGDSVLAASLLTSELSTPWSHVLRGQKW
ncbi:unnamed protein product [Scytosiphon promiscuus]